MAKKPEIGCGAVLLSTIPSKHGRRNNQAEFEIGVYSSQCLEKCRISNIADLTTEAQAWNQCTHRDQTTNSHKTNMKLNYTVMRTWY
jgi:hypothetical protein